MTSIEERNSKFYKKAGIEALKSRRETLIRLFNKGQFSFEGMMFGFGKLRIENKDQLLSRIKELDDLLGLQIKIRTEVVKFENITTKKELII